MVVTMLNLMLAAAAATQTSAVPSSQPVQGFQSASDLRSKCTGTSLHGQNYCYAYLAAVADSVTAYQTWLNLQDICVPSSMSQGELKDAFVAYLVEHPSQVEGQAASVVVTALQQRFPCSK
jgi:hypothetical protein